MPHTFLHNLVHNNLFATAPLEPAVLQRLQQPQQQCYPFLPMCAVFSCVQTMVWFPVFGIYKVGIHMSVHAIVYGGCMKWVSIESWLEEKSLVTLWNQTCISIAPGFSVHNSTSWDIPSPHALHHSFKSNLQTFSFPKLETCHVFYSMLQSSSVSTLCLLLVLSCVN